MARYWIIVVLAATTFLLSVAGIIACAFGVLQDVDHVALLQTGCFIGLIAPLYLVSRAGAAPRDTHVLHQQSEPVTRHEG